MGLQTWKDAPGGKIQRFDLTVAKKYLIEQELAIWLLEMVKDFVLKRGGYSSILEEWNLIENISKTLLQEMDCPYIFCLSMEKVLQLDLMLIYIEYYVKGKKVRTYEEKILT